MSLDIKRMCDRCGKEIPQNGKYVRINIGERTNKIDMVYALEVAASDSGIYAVDPFELCEKCAEKLNEFVNGKGKEECSGKS